MARKEIKIFMDSKEVSNFLKVIDWSWLFTFLSERYNVSLSPRKELKELHDTASRTIRTSTLAWTSTEKLTLSSTPLTEFSIWMPCMMDISIHGTLLRVVKRNALRNF